MSNDERLFLIEAAKLNVRGAREALTAEAERLRIDADGWLSLRRDQKAKTLADIEHEKAILDAIHKIRDALSEEC